ncbi:MAG: 50S ribosomal protein L17, partial [Patescibacteria group bacterium]
MHRHSYKGRKLGRDKAPRELMFRNLATSVVLHEKVRTTLPKAKEIRPIVEKLITTAKKGDVNATRKLNSYLLDKNAT